MQIYLVMLLVKLIMIIMEFLVLKNILIKSLRDKKLIDQPLKLTLDTNIQHLINKELSYAFKNILMLLVEAALLMDVENGEILSLVSLPNFNINKINLKTKNI